MKLLITKEVKRRDVDADYSEIACPHPLLLLAHSQLSRHHGSERPLLLGPENLIGSLAA